MSHNSLQDLIHHIHCLGYILYQKSMNKKFFGFRRFIFHDFYFRFHSSNASKMLLFNKISFYSKWLVIGTIFFFAHFAFLCSLLSSINMNALFDFNSTIFLIAALPSSSFMLPTTTLFESSYYFDLKWIITKKNHFFILINIFRNIFRFNFIQKKLSVSVNNNLDLLRHLF